MTDINVFLAFGGGLLSFISPCCLPLYPAFLSYITGVSVNELKEEKGMLRKNAILHTSLFLLGFSIIFIVLGISSSFVGSFFMKYKDLLRELGAVVIVFFGLVVLGVFKPSFLLKDKRVAFHNRPAGYLGSVLIGIGFAAGWTPCTGPILAAVLGMAVTHPNAAILYMICYVLGFAVPFFLLSFFIGLIKSIKKYNLAFMRTGGVLMVAMGVMLYFNWMTDFTSFLVNRVFSGFKGF
ncbi:cytochrome c biogenesis protein CcdA [Fictibacillus sp. Mic-4]|uniref:cytochrome c biogenesis CcdA family protein n=1 Tax=Fictibacillus TaxID=1329200 RepID=UPI00040B6FAE|nr:cytochrome c biogenesis protein CcdA [Fictibacillus gelatini]